MNRFIKKSVLLQVVVTLFATLATTGCAGLFPGGPGGGGHGGARLVQQQSFSSEALIQVIKDDNAQLVVLLN